jgi:hypothetical protein
MIVALAISVSLFGGLATWLFMTTGAFFIWAAFVAWACFFQSGGDANAFKTTIVSNVFGVFVAWSTALAIAIIGGGPIVGASLVALSIALYILAAHWKPLSSIPAVTYGYACTFAYVTQNADAFVPKVLLSLSMRNALWVIPWSMIIGACFAYASATFAGWLQNKALGPRMEPI